MTSPCHDVQDLQGTSCTPCAPSREPSACRPPAYRGARTAVALGTALLAAAGLAGCGQEAAPSQDEYAGRPQDGGTASVPGTGAPSTEVSGDPAAPAASPTAGPYADGSYSVSQAYGAVDDLVEEDSIDVTLTMSDGLVTQVEVVGNVMTSTSQEHVDSFSEAIDEAVVGRSVEDAHVHALAGASKTSEAFNKAVDAIAEQARQAAAQAS
ncbi:FMN-binding protein [Actinomyces wuliandei]|uniref:FMN-binding protein n=1 Tax=Actinomyces wuliandei TaxID=2057743 RepID=UPI001FA97EAE|nr:FMN-binding protein [Actinomyces wuliandei]